MPGKQEKELLSSLKFCSTCKGTSSALVKNIFMITRTLLKLTQWTRARLSLVAFKGHTVSIKVKK